MQRLKTHPMTNFNYNETRKSKIVYYIIIIMTVRNFNKTSYLPSYAKIINSKTRSVIEIQQIIYFIIKVWLH